MPTVNQRPLGLAGMGDLSAMPSSLGDAWQDSDKALVTPAGELRAWPGMNRMGMALFSPALHGAVGNRIALIAASERYIHKKAGHLLAAVDCSPGTPGRVLAVAHHESGVLGSTMVGAAVQTTGTGLSDLTPGGIYTGTSPAVYVLKIDGTGSPNTFKFSRDGGVTWISNGISITGSSQAVEKGITATFAALTGHTMGDAWTFEVGGRPCLLGQMNRVSPHDYPFLAEARGKILIGNAFNQPQVDDGAIVRDAGLRAPQMKPTVGPLSGALSSDIGHTEDATNQWNHPGSGVTVTRETATATPAPADGSAYVRISPTVRKQPKGTILAYTNMAGTPVSITATTTGITLNIQYCQPAHAGKKHYSLVFYSGADLTGTSHELPITGPRNGNVWNTVTLPWTVGASFTCACIALKIRSEHPDLYDILLDGIKVVDPTVTLTASSTLLAGGAVPWQFVFTWVKTTGETMESAPSPISDAITLNGASAQIDLSGSYPGILPGLANASPAWADSVNVYGFTPEFGNDPRFGGGQFFLLTSSSVPISTLTNLLWTMTDPIDRETLTEQPLAPWYAKNLEAFDLCVADGPLLVLASQPAYQVGSWQFTSGSQIVTPVSTGLIASTPVVGLWMEGRTIRRKDSLVAYRIVKAIMPSADYALGALYIGTTFDPDTNMFTGAYNEATAATAAIIEGDERSIYWTNNTGENGIDIESAAPLNSLTVLPAGDTITALFKVGEFLWVAGHNNLFLLRQDPGALADDPSDGTAYANPAHIPGVGVMGKRWWTSVPGGGAMFLSSKGELMSATPDGQSQKHPASDKLSALLSGWGYLTDTRQMINGFMDVVNNGKSSYVYLGLIGGGQDETDVSPGVRSQATDPWRNNEPNAPSLVEAFFDWSTIELPSNAAATINNDPSPVEAFDQGAIADDNFASQNAAITAFPSIPGQKWLTSTPGVICERVATGPIKTTESYVTSSSDPNFKLSTTDYGGVGLPRGGVPTNNFFPRGYWGVGVHRIRIPKGITPGTLPVGEIATYVIPR